MMTALATRNSVLLLKETLGGVILSQSRCLLVPGLNHGKASFSNEVVAGNYHQDYAFDSRIPWPISSPLYGEGWKGYGRLVVPTYDMTAEWATGLSKKALSDTTHHGRNLFRFISKLDGHTAYLLLIKKGKESSNYFKAELDKSKESIFDYTTELSARTKDAVKSGRAKKIFVDHLNSVMVKGRDLSNLIRKKLKENEDFIKKVTLFSIKSKDYTVSLLRKARDSKLPDEVYDRTGQIVKMTQVNAAELYQQSKLISKAVLDKSIIAGDLAVQRLTITYNQMPALIILIRNSKYVGHFQDALRRLEANSPKQDYTYVNKFFSRVSKQSVTNVVQNNKTEFPTMPPKQEFHSSAVQMFKPMKTTLNDFPQFLIFEKPNLWTNAQMTGEISALIPEPVKKIWRGLRDKSLPSWQATIASILQKIQDTVVKKKK